MWKFRPVTETLLKENKSTPWYKVVGKFFLLLLGAALSAVLITLSYPKFSISELAWVAFVPMFIGVLYLHGAWKSFFYSWFAATLGMGGIFYWIYITCVQGGDLPQGMSLAAWWGLSAIVALPYGILGGSCYYLKRTKVFFPFLAACAWVTVEWAHQLIAFYGIGFPWVMWGYTQWNRPEFIQIASYTGVYGVTFFLAFVNFSIVTLFQKKKQTSRVFHILTAVLAIAILFMWGREEMPSGKNAKNYSQLLRVKVALMQPNIDQYKKWNSEFAQEIKNVLSHQGKQIPAETLLTVWPESAVAGSLTDEDYWELFTQLADESQSYQIVGSNVSTLYAQYVGAYMLSPKTHELQRYEKIKLVPFGEFIPFERTLRTWFPDVEVLGELGSFTPGAQEQNLFDMDGILIGRSICYESIFPQLWRAQNKQGAKLFVNITNDAWFFNTSAPYQHLAANVLRAVEMKRPVLRAANTGFSAIIDPFGRIEQQSKLFTGAILRGDVPLPLKDAKNTYTQWGDWFAILCAVLYLTSLTSAMVFAYE